MKQKDFIVKALTALVIAFGVQTTANAQLGGRDAARQGRLQIHYPEKR